MAKLTTEGGSQSRAYVVRRLLRVFLPHLPLLLATMLASGLYAAAMTARVGLVYPVLRLAVEEEPVQGAPGGDGAGKGAEEAARGGETVFVRKLTKQVNEFSENLGTVERFLNGVDAAMLDLLPSFLLSGKDRKAQLQVATLASCTLIFATIMSLAAIANFSKIYLRQKLVVSVLVSIRVRLLENLLHQPLAFYNEQKRGELISRMSNDVHSATVCLNLLTSDLLEQPFMVMGPLLALVYVKWWFVFILATFFLIVTLSLRKQAKKVHRRAKVRQRTTARVTEAMVQMFSGIRVVKAFGLERQKVDHYTRRNEEFARDAMATEIAKAWTRTKMELLVHGAVLLVLLAGLFVVGSGATLSPVVGVLVIAFLTQIYRPTKVLTRAYTDLQDNLAGAGRVFEFMDLPPGMPDKRGAISAKEIVGTVRFEDVSFAYNGNGKVLEHINLEVPAGEVVALVGPSGAGKSTLVNLVPRFYDPDSGRITIDGTDIREFKRQSLLRHIAIVTQEPFLFNASVRENIAYGKPDASEEEIVAAAEAAHIHDFILSLPRGYDTIVGERGGNLSGGELQRITIARAVLRDARILILDEATSSLDSESEYAVQQALQNLMQGRTTLVIAHRLSTVQHADKICVMQDGQIREMGTHAQLMASETLYRRLYELQFAQ